MSATLYAALGGSANSDLYTVDPVTAAMTSVGPIGFAVTGLAFDPTNGTLYGVTSQNSPSNPRSLITVDPATGVGTLVGSLGTAFGQPAADIAFNAAGQLYGWVEGPDRLYTINKATGLATVVGPSGLSTNGDGMDFNSSDVLWACLRGDDQHIYTVNTATGVPTPQSLLTGGPFGDGASVNAGSFDATDVFYAVLNDFPITHLVTIDVSTGAISDVGAMLNGTDALAWGPAATLPNDFSVTLTPSTLTKQPGQTGTSTLATVITAGSAQSVALSATGAPVGVTVTFAANPITSGNSTVITVVVGGAVAYATYSIVIHCVGSLGATHDRALTLFVTSDLHARDDVNPDPDCAAVVGDYVTHGAVMQEFNPTNDPDDPAFFTMGQACPTFYVRGDRLPRNGLYTISMLVRGAVNGGVGASNILVRRNGMELLPPPRLANFLNPDTFRSLNTFPSTANAGPGPTAYPFHTDDVYEFVIFDSDPNFAVDTIRFTPVADGSGTYDVPMLAVPQPLPGPTVAASDLRLAPTRFPMTFDMCVTDDGKVWVIFVEFTVQFAPSPARMVVKMWDGISWTLITDDLWGRGAGATVAYDPWVGCEAFGNDVFFLFGDYVTGITGHPAFINEMWRVKQYSGGVFTELGTGQRAINGRTNAGAIVADEGAVPTLAVSPLGLPFVAWGENPDINGSQNLYPHCWYWDGAAWVDTGLMPNTNTGSFWTVDVVSNVRVFGITFWDHTGHESDWPSLLFSYQNRNSAPVRLAFQYQEYNGSVWLGTLDFISSSVWSGLQTNGSSPLQHATQGLDLFVYQGKVTMCARLFDAAGVIGVLNSAGTAFAPPASGQFYDRMGWDSTKDGIFGFNTTGIPEVDADGNLWMAVDLNLRTSEGPMIIGKREIGTQDGWASAHYDPQAGGAGGTHLPLYQDDGGYGDSTLRFHGNQGYLISVLSQAFNGFPIIVYTFAPDVPYRAIGTPSGGAVFDGAPVYRIISSSA